MLKMFGRRCINGIYFLIAGQEDFSSNIVHFSNVGSMLGQSLRHWPNIKTALGECLVRVVVYR